MVTMQIWSGEKVAPFLIFYKCNFNFHSDDEKFENLPSLDDFQPIFETTTGGTGGRHSLSLSCGAGCLLDYNGRCRPQKPCPRGTRRVNCLTCKKK